MSTHKSSDSKREGHLLDSEEYTLRKRLPKRLPTRKNDVYVNRKTEFNAQMARCVRMLDEECQPEIFIHGLGAAVNRALTLALRLKDHYKGSVDIAVNTSSVELIDDLEPEKDNLEPETNSRINSAVHVKVCRLKVS